MAIQQQLNQLLYSANIGAGFYSQTPAYQEKYFKRHQVEPTKKIAEGATEEFEASKAEIDKLIEELDLALKNPKGQDLDIARAGEERLRDIDYRLGVYSQKLAEGMRRFPTEFSDYHDRYINFRDIHGQVKERLGALKERKKQLKKTLKGVGETVDALTEADINRNMKVQHQDNVFNEDGEK